MAKTKRKTKASQRKRDKNRRGGILNREKERKRLQIYRDRKKGKSGPPTHGWKQSERDVPTSKAPPFEAGFPSKVRYSKAYKSIIYQHPSLL